MMKEVSCREDEIRTVHLTDPQSDIRVHKEVTLTI